jgi:hypothetical protein
MVSLIIIVIIIITFEHTLWLEQQGHAVTCLTIQSSGDATHWRPSRGVQGRGHGVQSILEALAAAGQRPGGMRLQQLQVPAFGLSTPSSLARALSGCRNLMSLHLDPDCGMGLEDFYSGVDRGLAGALQQLTQLTALRLSASGWRHISPAINGLIQCLPESLEVLDMDFHCVCTVNSSSLQHLAALKQLTLPIGLTITDNSIGDPLRPLTALTHLSYWDNMEESSDGALTVLPTLVDLWSDPGDAGDLGMLFQEHQQEQELSSKIPLRSLACVMSLVHNGADADALAQLAQLTQLRLRLAALVAEVETDHLVTWAATVACLTGLRSLALQPELLQQVDLAAFTALTRLEVITNTVYSGALLHRGYSRLKGLLGAVVPSCGRLQEVVVLGVPAEMQPVCRSAVAAAVGDVPLVVRENCSGRVWCVCCSER